MKAIWEEVKSQIRSELPNNSFSLWIKPLSLIEVKDDALVLGCPNKFSRNWIIENYLGLIRDKLLKAVAKPLDLVFKTETAKAQPAVYSPDSEQRQLAFLQPPFQRSRGRIRLNTHFTFDRFVVGRCNEFAYSASKAIANGARWDYHSLLMLASTGLGKSHLSQAVGHAILSRNPEARVHYMTAEDFTNEMVLSLKNNCIQEFKNKYRRCCDVLLLEEIQFLSGKEKTQLELGYTLDALANSHKKVIFTSSLSPKDLPRISKQLSSRLTSGLVTTLERPDFQTRLKILANKAAQYNLALSEEIFHILASGLKRDIRQMESALRCLKAKSELVKAKIDTGLAKEVVDCLSGGERSVKADDIKKLVCKYYRIEPHNLESKSRKRLYTHPRNIYVYLCRQHTDETTECIAKTVKRSHSTVVYASELVEHKMKRDAKMRREIDFLADQIKQLTT